MGCVKALHVFWAFYSKPGVPNDLCGPNANFTNKRVKIDMPCCGCRRWLAKWTCCRPQCVECQHLIKALRKSRSLKVGFYGSFHALPNLTLCIWVGLRQLGRAVPSVVGWAYCVLAQCAYSCLSSLHLQEGKPCKAPLPIYPCQWEGQTPVLGKIRFLSS